MFVGDFNARLAGPGNICIPNSKGVALEELVHRNNLYVASVGDTTSGPVEVLEQLWTMLS